MADIKLAVQELGKLEFEDKYDILHKNEGENGLTFFGIYQSANPTWRGWDIINRYLANEPDLRKCSAILSNVSDLMELVYKLYKIKEDNAVKRYDYKEAKKSIEYIIQNYGHLISEDIRKNAENNLKIWTVLVNQPAQLVKIKT